MNRYHSAVAVVAVLLIGCAAGEVRDVRVSPAYVKTQKKCDPPTRFRAVAVGKFRDARKDRPANVLGERHHFDAGVDRFVAPGGLARAMEDLVRGYYESCGVRVSSSTWDGDPPKIRNQEGDLVIAGRVLEFWFESSDLALMGQGKSELRVELIVGSPRTGRIVTKSVQVDTLGRRNLFWETGHIRKWLSMALSESLEIGIPEAERALGR